MTDKGIIHILLADDDRDDRFLFKEALSEISLDTSLHTVDDGEQLMEHLNQFAVQLPHVLFLDLNMPRKNGFECLAEIKQHPELMRIPVVTFSTSYDEAKAVELFENGAQYYICKPADFDALKDVIFSTLMKLQKGADLPSKENFVINGNVACD